MSERIEWIEPEEATRERRERRHAEMQKLSRITFRCGMVVGIPAVLSLLFFSLELGEIVKAALSIFAVPIYLSVAFGLATRFERQNSEHKCVLSAEDAARWRIRSFEITDHPNLPCIRCITILRQTSPHKAQLNFREGQLDEAELGAFVEARIAEQRAARLMRRVRR